MPLDREDGTATGQRETVLNEGDFTRSSLASFHGMEGINELGEFRLTLHAGTLGKRIRIRWDDGQGAQSIRLVREKKGADLKLSGIFGKTFHG